ncbi:flagellar motor protein MotB [Algirhabdus cladophorae]|uniref:flagellar motor protein MotB n=1 Tax=Algirhabdus cladophorae TaxID=3377108 RepID=UPI003B848EB5
MAAQNLAPVIIKKKKVVGGDGHHGGAWKVAYADFVTAMMAFFMLMWLLNATTEKQRKGLADYFTPTIPVNRISGGGDGAFGGTSTLSETILPQSGTGGMVALPLPPGTPNDPSAQDASGKDEEEFGKIEEALLGLGGESFEANELLKHIVTKVTDEGLVIEIFETQTAFLFEQDGLTPTDLLVAIAEVLVPMFDLVTNGVAVEAHVRMQPIVARTDRTWEASLGQSQSMRQLLVEEELDSARIKRVVGHADRELVSPNPLDRRNNRLEVILLRSD